MTQAMRLTAMVAAFAMAILTGSASVYANQKERIGIDNVDMCQAGLYDPNCSNDEEEIGVQAFVETPEVIVDETADVEDEANVLRRRYQNLNDDGIADSE